jgi:hypothetical protein
VPSPIAACHHEFKNQASINSKEPIMETREHREAWNKGKLVGQKAPLKPKDIWAIRIHLQNAHAVRDLAMFNLAIDSTSVQPPQAGSTTHCQVSEILTAPPLIGSANSKALKFNEKEFVGSIYALVAP